MSVTHINSVSQLNGVLSDSTKLTVIDFHASWCGPCHAIAPTFEALAKQYPNVNFVKCDVDAARDVASTYKVSAMPTFIFLQGSKQIHTIRGADKSGLQNAIQRFAGSSSTGVFSGQGQTLGGAPPPVTDSLTATASSIWSNMDPPVKVLLGLLAVYVFFWLM
ncbi:thioredoxin-domain-containing protein [Imleria badia]|nr:thioredoxin-domain-containing protein [Imleria badia]